MNFWVKYHVVSSCVMPCEMTTYQLLQGFVSAICYCENLSVQIFSLHSIGLFGIAFKIAYTLTEGGKCRGCHLSLSYNTIKWATIFVLCNSYVQNIHHYIRQFCRWSVVGSWCPVVSEGLKEITFWGTLCWVPFINGYQCNKINENEVRSDKKYVQSFVRKT